MHACMHCIQSYQRYIRASDNCSSSALLCQHNICMHTDPASCNCDRNEATSGGRRVKAKRGSVTVFEATIELRKVITCNAGYTGDNGEECS